MKQQFTIENFIDNCWAEAKEELAQNAPEYVAALQATGSLMQHGFVLPEGLPSPLWRLPVVWQDCLETTFDVVQTIEWLNLTLALLEANLDRRNARYYFEAWIQIAYNLCEKILKLITNSCTLASLNNRTKKKYRRLVETEVKYKVGQFRQAIVHGVDDTSKGGLGISAKSITNDQLWEGGVFLGLRIIKTGLDSAYEEGGYLSAHDYLTGMTEATTNFLAQLGEILELLDHEIGNGA